MAILILPICFAAIFFNTGILSDTTKGKKELILRTVLVFCGLIVLITELFSLFHALNFKTILLSWLTITILNLLYLYLKKDQIKTFYNHLKQEFRETSQKIKIVKWYEKWLLFSVLIILVLVFVQGIVYPPNNWDSMYYHLARIPSWISHQSVAHYPTLVLPQIYQPPFAEFVIMHFNILNRADYFSNVVQLLFLLFSIIGLVLIVESFKLNTSFKILAVFLGLTIPEVILQAESTQNDIVVSFFIITAFYFAIKALKEFNSKNAFNFGLAVGLGILTKGTAYIYMPFPLLIFFVAFLFNLYSKKNYKYLLYSFLSGMMFLMINFGFYYRNYQLTNNLLGVDQKVQGSYSNEKMSAELLLLSIIKNTGNHVGLFHLKPLSVLSAKTIIKLYNLAGIDINDPANNFFKDKFDTLYFPAHQDWSPNFIYLLLIIISIVIITLKIFKRRIDILVILLAITILLQYVLFCFYLKWQPYHTRLHTPIFLLSVPLVCFAVKIAGNSLKRLFYWATPFLSGYAIMIILANMNAPYNSTITNHRLQNYFIAKPYLYTEYENVIKSIEMANYKNIGLIMNDNDSEYSLFTQCYSKAKNPVYINVNNYTKNSMLTSVVLNCIVTNYSYNNPYLDYQGKRFYNQNLKNKFIHLYK